MVWSAGVNITLEGEHIPGVHNGVADALSRYKHMAFLLQVPSARGRPSGSGSSATGLDSTKLNTLAKIFYKGCSSVGDRVELPAHTSPYYTAQAVASRTPN